MGSRISFCMPCYNDGDSVEKAIYSILDDQDYKNVEMIVVNDGSKDSSRAVLDKLVSKRKYKDRLKIPNRKL